MNKRGDVQRLRGVLRLGALVFAITSLVLFIAPLVLTDHMGLPGSLNLDWSMQLSGVTILTLGGLMFVIAQAGSTNGVLWAARVMMVGAFGLGVMTLLIPTGGTWLVILYALIGFGFSAAYLVFLARRNAQID
jgi:hypothetical protein